MKSNFIFVLTLFSIGLYAQEEKAVEPNSSTIENLLTKPHPDGVYKTMFDFLRKVPNNQFPLTPRGLQGLQKPELMGTPEVCYFFYKFGDPKVDAFAVCYQGNVYFKIKSILNNKSKRGQSEASIFPNSFVRVVIAGPDYMYTVADLGNAWSMGVAANVGAPMSISDQRTGIVWDRNNKVFYIFKFCEDFNTFIAPLKPEFVQECRGKNKAPDLLGIQNAIAAFKSD